MDRYRRKLKLQYFDNLEAEIEIFYFILDRCIYLVLNYRYMDKKYSITLKKILHTNIHNSKQKKFFNCIHIMCVPCNQWFSDNTSTTKDIQMNNLTKFNKSFVQTIKRKTFHRRNVEKAKQRKRLKME